MIPFQIVGELPRRLSCYFAAFSLLLAGCERSSRLSEVPSDPAAREAALLSVEKEIEVSPKEGNLYLERLALMLGDSDVSPEAVQLWKQLCEVPGGKTALSNLVAHPNAAVRMNAARLAANTSLTEAISTLKKGAEDREPDVRIVCLWALGELGDNSSYMLLALLLRDSFPAVRGQSATTLQSYPCRDSARRLLELVEDPSEYVQYCAAVSLIKMAGDPEVRSELRDSMATDSEQNSRHEVSAIALAGIGEQDALDFLETNLRKPGMFRKLAAEALVRSDPPRAMRVFGEILSVGEKDPDMKQYMSSELASLRNLHTVH